MKRTFWMLLGLLAIVATLAATPVWADTCDRTEDVALLGQNMTIESGETFCGDIAIMGGSLVVEQDAKVRGDIAIAGGSATVDGTVDGDIAVFGGQVTLGETALVTGDVALAGGTLNREAGARVEGRVAEAGDFPDLGFNFTPGTFNFLEGGAVRARGPMEMVLAAMWWGFRTVMKIFILGALAFLLALLAPNALRNATRTAEQSPIESFAVGCLGILAMVLLIILSAITIIGIPVALVLVVILVAGLLYGLIVTGTLLGERLLKGLNVTAVRLTTAAVVGVVLIEILRALTDVVPLMGGLLSFTVSVLVISLGAGAVVLSRGGQQVYGGKGISAFLPGDSGNTPPPPATPTPTPPAPPAPPAPTGPDPLDELFADLETEATDEEAEEDKPTDDEATDDDTPTSPSAS
ncbi:hypothetical protein ARMA_3101 [Ardenticatena maritima]|uniref:DUF8173 domain-containing protein n=1 Tax=Ardenticatena maritima TaxID=872965 RepID=A0A0M9UE35_9CHLR|nr:polymer-forming cytoskeletal protein [Ardenticatena maritima]KPL86338.1 hypothetical protein SE16_13520 [Ardenticatena maritima]GAP64678.1 hypothetical protein ARMA_3101 [Ardenticatena maritima]